MAEQFLFSEAFASILRKRVQLLITATILILLVTASPSVLSKVPTMDDRKEQLLQIIYVVQNVDGYLDETLHGEFWGIIESTGASADDFSAFINNLIDIEQVLEYPYEAWTSAKETYARRNVFRTPRLDVLESKLERKLGKDFDAPKKHTALLLKAAANRSYLEAKGQKLYVTNELIEQVLNGAEGSMLRVKNLLNPSWKPNTFEQDINEMNLRLLTSTPFQIEQDTINGVSTVTAQRIDRTKFLVIGMLRVPPKTAYDYGKGLKGSCRGAMNNFGSHCDAIDTYWRGHKGISANASSELDGETLHLTYTGYAIPSQRRVFWILVVNNVSALTGSSAVEELKSVIMFDWE